MKQEALKYFPNIDLTLLAFFLFFGSFIAIILFVFFQLKKNNIEYMSNLPLKDEEKS